jgi:hypothetical protein
MGGAWGGEKYIENFGWKALREDITRKIST